MRYSSIVFLLSILSVIPLPAAAEKMTPRPLDPVAAETFERALSGSPRVRALVATLESSNVIVHIETSRLMPDGIAGTTRFVSTRGGFRYVRVTIHAELPKELRAAILGHELQHACEVAESGADSAAEVRELFERAGERNGNFYETRAAVETEKHVRMELQVGRVLQAEPVIKFHH
jgi:hypothetical protein